MIGTFGGIHQEALLALQRRLQLLRCRQLARTASERDRPGSHTDSARAYADFRGLSTAPSPTACPGHQRWDTFYNRREHTVISPPWLAVSLWSRRQGDAFACRLRPLLHTFFAGWPGRSH